jgi:hypothetical protein
LHESVPGSATPDSVEGRSEYLEEFKLLDRPVRLRRAEIERIGYTIIANMGEQPPTCSAELATELKNRGAVTGRMKHYAGNSRAS